MGVMSRRGQISNVILELPNSEIILEIVILKSYKHIRLNAVEKVISLSERVDFVTMTKLIFRHFLNARVCDNLAYWFG